MWGSVYNGKGSCWPRKAGRLGTKGRKLWTTFVEPPWFYRLDGETLHLNVMDFERPFSSTPPLALPGPCPTCLTGESHLR